MPKLICPRCPGRIPLDRDPRQCSLGYTHVRWSCPNCGRQWDQRDAEKIATGKPPLTEADRLARKGLAAVPEWDRLARQEKARGKR